MRYIKLFETFSEEPKFFRFSHIDLLNGESEIEFTPKQRKMIGPDVFNDILLELGFPDKKKCIHFMDERAFDPSYSGLYGKNHYNISIDPDSKIGWSFLFPVNDWYFKGLPFKNTRHEDIKRLEETEFGDLNYREASEDEIFNSTMRVLEIGFIGTGKLADLMASKYWGNEKVFVWTEDTVRITPYIKPPKGSKGYKKEILLTTDQFKTLGMSGPDIAEFHKSDEGKQFRELEDRMSAVKLVISYLKRIGKFNMRYLKIYEEFQADSKFNITWEEPSDDYIKEEMHELFNNVGIFLKEENFDKVYAKLPSLFHHIAEKYLKNDTKDVKEIRNLLAGKDPEKIGLEPYTQKYL